MSTDNNRFDIVDEHTRHLTIETKQQALVKAVEVHVGAIKNIMGRNIDPELKKSLLASETRSLIKDLLGFYYTKSKICVCMKNTWLVEECIDILKDSQLKNADLVLGKLKDDLTVFHPKGVEPDLFRHPSSGNSNRFTLDVN